jgi:predicted acetyltransferase
MSSRLELIPAGLEHQPVLANLLELYIHDFSQFVPTDIAEDGRFGYHKLPLYWSDPRRYPFLARLDGSWAGFALVQKIENDICDMAEFFVLRRYRRTGLGAELASRIWLRFPGPWQIRVRAANRPAQPFWESTIARFTGHPTRSTTFQADGADWHLFSFESR